MSDDGDDFDFYPCSFEDQPASIYVNLRWDREAPPAGADTRYDVIVAMSDPGPTGLGTEDEGTDYDRLETALVARAGELGVRYVGRVRHRGAWWITLYGAAGHEPALREVAEQHAAGRRVRTRCVADPAWGHYRELLLPDADRRRWMEDRRLVHILKEQGDVLATPRRVDHHLHFTTAAARDAFLAQIAPAGFAADDPHGLSVRIHRTDPIELDHIHEVVMQLVDAATAHGGTYDRWEASIES